VESCRKECRGQNDESEAKKGRTDPPTPLSGVAARGVTPELAVLLHGTAAARKFGVADRVDPQREGRLSRRLALPQFRPDSMRWPVVRQALNGLQCEPNLCRGSYTLLMCGRYRLVRKKEILAAYFDVENDMDRSAAMTSPPGQDVAFIRQDGTRPIRSFSSLISPLQENTSSARLAQAIRGRDTMLHWRVSTRVNSVLHDDPARAEECSPEIVHGGNAPGGANGGRR
jgi:hypothetical protein